MHCPICGRHHCTSHSVGSPYAPAGWWAPGDEIARWDVCSSTPISTGVECGAPAAYHFWVERASGEAFLPAFCAEHAKEWRIRFGDELQREHVWRRGGSACGIEGTSWHAEPNICLPDAGDTVDPLWSVIGIEVSV